MFTSLIYSSTHMCISTFESVGLRAKVCLPGIWKTFRTARTIHLSNKIIYSTGRHSECKPYLAVMLTWPQVIYHAAISHLFFLEWVAVSGPMVSVCITVTHHSYLACPFLYPLSEPKSKLHTQSLLRPAANTSGSSGASGAHRDATI